MKYCAIGLATNMVHDRNPSPLSQSDRESAPRAVRGSRRPLGLTRFVRPALITVAFGLVGLVAFEASPWFHDQVLTSVSRRPTPFTELYFSDRVGLPKHLGLRQPQRFRFVIANHEGRAIGYTVQVVLHGPQGDVPLATDTVRVPSGRTSEQAVQMILDQVGTYVVSVQLLGRPEYIHFSVTS